MKKINISTWLLALVGGIWAFVSLIFGIITGADGDFWVGFAFLTFGAIVAVAVLLLFAGKDTDIRDAYLSFPIYYIGAFYFAANGLIAVLHMLMGLLSFKWLFVIELIVFAAFAVYFILLIIGKKNVENVSEKVQLKNDFIRRMTVRVENIAVTPEDRETRAKLESLAEEFKYSKPIAHVELVELESKIELAVEELAAEITEERIKSVRLMLMQRNNTAKLLK